MLIALLYMYMISRLYSYLPFITSIILLILTTCVTVYARDINEFVDTKVVRRAKELVEIGCSVLIVRGKKTHWVLIE